MAGHDVFLLLGSNLDPSRHLPEAVSHLSAQFDIVRLSSWIETRPVGMPEGTPNFHNRAIRIRTDLALRAVHTSLKQIERAMGRTPDQRGFTSRTIDIDMMIFDSFVLQKDDLSLPHPDIERFYHAARLLAELDPGRPHPVSGRTLREIAAGLAPSGEATILRVVAAMENP